jgi:pSer/pThr/pTyr-binding forkhead associated (FHA) protein
LGCVLELLYEGRGIVIEGDEVVLGRVKSCTLRVVHPLVSRQHCRLTIASDGIFVEDMGSSNGTFVNGDRVRGRDQVRAGDRVTLGRGPARRPSALA